jgi:hypothetical protein
MNKEKFAILGKELTPVDISNALLPIPLPSVLIGKLNQLESLWLTPNHPSI